MKNLILVTVLCHMLVAPINLYAQDSDAVLPESDDSFTFLFESTQEWIGAILIVGGSSLATTSVDKQARILGVINSTEALSANEMKYLVGKSYYVVEEVDGKAALGKRQKFHTLDDVKALEQSRIANGVVRPYGKKLRSIHRYRSPRFWLFTLVSVGGGLLLVFDGEDQEDAELPSDIEFQEVELSEDLVWE